MQGTYTEKIKRSKPKPTEFERKDSKRDKQKNNRYLKERDRKRNYDE